VFAGIILPVGLGGFAVLVPGVQRRKPWWIVCGLLAIAMVVAAEIAGTGPDDDNTAGFFLIIGWVISIVTVLAIRKPFLALEAQPPSAWDTGKAAAQRRLKERQEALALLASDPQLAREIGVGRPDQRGAQDAGLIDVNHVPAAFIAKLPGFDPALAERVVTIREDVNGFSGLADFGAVADLDGNLVERIRDRAVFLPR
jgi:hypothetical protein